MMKGEFIHHNHGETFHNLAVMITKSICAERGYTFLDPRPFKDKAIYPGDPDVIVRITGKRGMYEHKIIEIDTNPTKATNTKKIAQFSGDGITDLILIDLRMLTKKKDWKVLKIGDLYDFLEVWVP